ncbi:PREDICTED: uncharacterized protein LOC108560920 [Nicrophorus vespilloides]|uniref:Uncharacterized protein LOC108560920 n=1 Tax=Nicrophorus vespilloides TaxID=110193 RepID=A0ABM1MHS9_NICVS|nr:PREDICTED: uncharacterized protein LOC108560920 [Nicrophorus vespilloides]
MPEFEVKNLDKILSDSLGKDVVVIEQRSKFLTPPGEHYGSIMLALDATVKIDGKEEILPLVAKMLPASDMLRVAFDSGVTFQKEIDAYTKTIPALVQFQRDYNVPEHKILDIFPKCFGARISLDKDEVDENAVLIFENLKVKGYDTGDRFVGFDLPHAQMIVKDLAKFHAVPIAMKKLRPNDFDKYVGPCIIPNAGIETLPDDIAAAFTDSIIEIGKTIPELSPYLEKITEIVLTSTEDMKNKNGPPIITPYATAVHSDYWVNNTMVLRDANGNPLKNKIVDLQIMQYDHALRDLIFFLFTSVQNPVLDAHYDDLIKLYHETFYDYLKDFGAESDDYSWKNFLTELEDIGPKEFHHVAFMLKPIFTEKGKINNLSEFKPSDWGRRDLIGPAHKQKLKDTILAYVKRNWI